MEIKFVKAEKMAENQVNVTYALNNTQFTAEWHKIGNCDFSLDTYIESADQDLAGFISEQIGMGEESDLYTMIRDTFDAQHCEDVE